MMSLAEVESATELVVSSDVRYQPLNPARGDASPKAGLLWGDIRADADSGAIIEFVDGFSSPPHIHNVTYRGVVLSGKVHNDDPNAEKLWMGPGSFWIQPAGESHITAAAPGSKARILLEIHQGPYLVQPPEQAYDNGERPLNVAARNLVWIDASDIGWVRMKGDHPEHATVKVAYLWGNQRDGQRNGTLLWAPEGFLGEVSGGSAWLRAIVITGSGNYQLPDGVDPIEIDAGSYFGGDNGAAHRVECTSLDGCQIYVTTEGRYSLSEL